MTAMLACLLALVLVSWFLSAAAPELPVRSLLSSEGIRWFMGQFAYNISHPAMGWLLLTAMAAGAVNHSGLYIALTKITHPRRLGFRERFALRLVAFEMIVAVAVMLLLTLLPHAILLNVEGGLGHSSFSASVYPYSMLAIIVCSVTYAMMSGRHRSLTEMYTTIWIGLRECAFLFPILLMILLLWKSIAFIFFEK